MMDGSKKGIWNGVITYSKHLVDDGKAMGLFKVMLGVWHGNY